MSEWLRSGDPSRIYTNEYAFDVSNVDLSNLAERFTLADGDFVIELADPERWTAEQLASRTSGFSVPRWACPSIEAGDVRTIAFTVPVEATKLEARLVYRLVPPPLATALGLDGQPEAQPRGVAQAFHP